MLHVKPFYSWLQTVFPPLTSCLLATNIKSLFHRKLSHLDFTLKVHCVFVSFYSHFKFLFIFIFHPLHFLLTFAHTCTVFLKKNCKCSFYIICKHFVILFVNFLQTVICLFTIFIIPFPIQNFSIYMQVYYFTKYGYL